MSAIKALSSKLLMILLVGFACWTPTKPCTAQGLRRYQPSSPTVSPYLNLNRANDGGLPNYYALVRPLNRQRQTNFETERLQRQQKASLQQLERTNLQRTPVIQSVTGIGSRFRTLGNRSVYRDTLQFYPTVTLRR